MINPAGNPFPWLLLPVLLIQGMWVKHHTPKLPEAPGPAEGRYGASPLLRLTALGDSIIAGVGVAHTEQALPAQMAAALSRKSGRGVQWTRQGRNGARTRDLLQWDAGAHWREADILLVSNGLNDVTSLMAARPWLREKRALYTRLRQQAPQALIAQLGLPPLGHFPALPNPLRWVLGRRASAFDRHLEQLIAELPGVVYLPFRSQPDPSLFAEDGYHPGPEAVRIWAESLAESIVPLLHKGER